MASLKRKSQGNKIIKLENQLMACRKRKPQTKDITVPNKKIKVENQTDSKEITGPEPRLDDDIIREILRLLPTKSSVLMTFLSKQWQSVWSALPAIDLDFDGEGGPLHGNNEDDNPHHNHHIVDQHAKFINMFSWFVGFRQQDKQQQQQQEVVEKFRIRMVGYSLLEDEATVMDEWLRFGLERSVKELDVSLLRGGGKVDYFFPGTLFSSKSLTTLKLEHVTVTIEPHRPVITSMFENSVPQICLH